MSNLYIKRFKLEFKNDAVNIEIENIAKKEINSLEKPENVQQVSADIKNPIITDKYLILKFYITLK